MLRAFASSCVVLAFVLSPGCLPPPTIPPPTERLIDAWSALAVSDRPEDCDGHLASEWIPNNALHDLGCRADQAQSLAALAQRAPALIWDSGPHEQWPGALWLNLTTPEDFGHYNPAFVRWAAEHLTPDLITTRDAAQPAYDAHVRDMARVYRVAYGVLSHYGYLDAIPAGPLLDYSRGLKAGYAEWHGSGQELRSVVANTIGELDPEASAILVQSDGEIALGFWLRRRQDGTAREFLDGLDRLLDTFDSEWRRAYQYHTL